MCLVFVRRLCLAKLVGLVVALLIVGVFAPPTTKRCPYFLQNTLVVRESKAYCAQYEESLGSFFKALYEVASNETSLGTDPGQVTKSIKIGKKGLFVQSYWYIFTQMNDEVTKFSLILYLLEAFTVASKNRDGRVNIPDDFFVFCDELGKKDYFVGEERMDSTLDLIRRLSSSDSNIRGKDKLYEDYLKGKLYEACLDDEEWVDDSDDEEQVDDTDDEAPVDVNLDIIKRLCSDDSSISKDELREKIRLELEAKEAFIMKVFSDIAAKVQGKKRFLEDSAAGENTKLNVRLLDYFLNRLLTFSDKVYSLAVLRMHWMQKALFAFVGGEENLGESISFKLAVRRLEIERQKASDDCVGALNRVIALFRDDFAPAASTASSASS